MIRICLLTLCWAALTACLSLHMKTDRPSVVVVGCAGGAAETIACKLLERGEESITVALDRRPLSPLLKQAIAKSQSKLYYGDLDKDLEGVDGVRPLSALMDGRLVICVGDEGDDALRGRERKKERNAPISVVGAVASKLPATAKGVICSAGGSADSRGGIGALFGGKASDDLRSVCTKNSLSFSLLKYGQLTGGVPGNDPLPFIGLPALEPELHPSFVLRAVLITDANNKYSDSDMCTREALAEATVRLLSSGDVIEGQVVSIAGEPPTDKQWGQLFARLRAADNVELLRIDFQEVLKPSALLSWLADSWFPQALIDADAATILSGARPVRVTRSSDRSLRIIWEELQSDLTVRVVGGVELRIETEPEPCVVAVRISSGGSLPGEMPLMDRLLEGVNKSVYKKQLAVAKK